MKFLSLLLILSAGAWAHELPKGKADELYMAQAEAKAYREAWLQLQRRDELLGLATLSDDVRDSHDKVARLSGELIRAEQFTQQILEQVKAVTQAAVTWAG